MIVTKIFSSKKEEFMCVLCRNMEKYNSMRFFLRTNVIILPPYSCQNRFDIMHKNICCDNYSNNCNYIRF